MKNEFTYPSLDKKTQIHAIEWKPEGEIKAIVQICHGMVEYIDRYDAFAQYLCDHGYYVLGNDHLGHGESVQGKDYYGFFDKKYGNEILIGDIHRLRHNTRKNYPDLPYFMMGHSMGSFLVREYIELYGKDLAGAIVMGTGSQPSAVLSAGKMLCRLTALFRGWNYRSNFIDNLAFGSYNKQFEPGRTDRDWLTKDEKIVDAYRADPWCTFQFTVNAYFHLFRCIEFMQQKENIKKIPSGLPILLVSGACDPVGNNGKALTKIRDEYNKYGIRDVEIKLYENDRHEILNETDRETVYEDLLHWLESQRIR